MPDLVTEIEGDSLVISNRNLELKFFVLCPDQQSPIPLVLIGLWRTVINRYEGTLYAALLLRIMSEMFITQSASCCDTIVARYTVSCISGHINSPDAVRMECTNCSLLLVIHLSIIMKLR